ncbi:hypothetical protein [Leucobacter denitrificans]|uniref:Uncharacterized protein n=1 Tax=Leucobacter denitrificans TaxID=683042 RepID=A0A7G9S4Y0_9MICO|nr:hypothetical protein [Leucobacter denitrificans]QNN62905.1 hypothetical protein H9L06_00470 [Leucobacter denitrificans]
MNITAALPSLQQRINEMQPLRLGERALPTTPGLSPLLPGGALQMGATYAVRGSWQLALAFLAEASRGGAWCGVLGCPYFGAEAAAALGIALDRCVLIPTPGPHALSLVGTLSETLTVVVAHFDTRVSPAQAERVSARLREHGSALVIVGDWVRSESRLTVMNSRWSGLGSGYGAISSRQLTVQSEDRRGTRQHVVNWSHDTFTVDQGPAANAPLLRAV